MKADQQTSRREPQPQPMPKTSRVVLRASLMARRGPKGAPVKPGQGYIARRRTFSGLPCFDGGDPDVDRDGAEPRAPRVRRATQGRAAFSTSQSTQLGDAEDPESRRRRLPPGASPPVTGERRPAVRGPVPRARLAFPQRRQHRFGPGAWRDSRNVIDAAFWTLGSRDVPTSE
jgi:hypothetical protein